MQIRDRKPDRSIQKNNPEDMIKLPFTADLGRGGEAQSM
jgi:hypothetical protein